MPTEPPDGDPARPVTIYDVAAAAGVAPSTVSRTFSRPGRVNAETAERVRAIAGDLGYRAHLLSGSAPSERTLIIALLVSDVTNPFYNEIIEGAEDAAAQAGYTMLLANTKASDRVEREVLERVLPTVEGVVLATTVMSDAAIRTIAKQRPVVVLNRTVSGVSSITSDTALGMRRAVQHLVELGHHRIAYVAGPEASWTDGIRWRSLREAAIELQLQSHRLGPFSPDVAGGERAVDELVNHPSTAVVTYNDRMAIGLIRKLTVLGVAVPGDVSVIGFDNIFAAALVNPPLTTVAAPLHAMGTVAVRTLMAIIHGAQSHTGDPDGHAHPAGRPGVHRTAQSAALRCGFIGPTSRPVMRSITCVLLRS